MKIIKTHRDNTKVKHKGADQESRDILWAARKKENSLNDIAKTVGKSPSTLSLIVKNVRGCLSQKEKTIIKKKYKVNLKIKSIHAKASREKVPKKLQRKICALHKKFNKLFIIAMKELDKMSVGK
jgi:hypothetical protein